MTSAEEFDVLRKDKGWLRKDEEFDVLRKDKEFDGDKGWTTQRFLV